MNRSIITVCAALGIAVLTGCNKGGQPNAAVVNGQAITMDEFQKYLMVMNQVNVIVNPTQLQANPGGGPVPTQAYRGQVVGSIGLQALGDLVKQTVLKQMAQDAGVMPTQDQVTAELEDRQKQNQSFITTLTAGGLTIGMIRNEIALELAQFNLTTQGITVSDADVQKYIDEHKDDFRQAEQDQMTWILVNTDKAKAAADADLKKGMEFIKVAESYSVAPDAQANQFRFPTTDMKKLAAISQQFADVVAKTPVSRATDWIKSGQGWAKFYVTKRMPSMTTPIDDSIRKRVKKALMVQKGTEGKDLGSRIQEKLKTSKYDILIESLKEPWKKEIETLTPPTAAGGPAPK